MTFSFYDNDTIQEALADLSFAYSASLPTAADGILLASGSTYICTKCILRQGVPATIRQLQKLKTKYRAD